MSHEETELNALRRQLDEAFLRDDPLWGIIANKLLMIARAKGARDKRDNMRDAYYRSSKDARLKRKENIRMSHAYRKALKEDRERAAAKADTVNHV